MKKVIYILSLITFNFQLFNLFPHVSATNTDFYNHTNIASRLWKTTTGGQSWLPELPIHNSGIPDRVITSITTDPQPGFENVVYLTLSGFNANTPNNPGHVFKSVDGGYSWSDISNDPYDSYSLPDLPVNYMLVRRISPTQKELIISTDAGVYHIMEGGPIGYIRWQPLAIGLPSLLTLGLHYNDATLKLRVATFGRGAYEVQLQGPIYVSNELVLTAGEDGVNVGDDIVVGPGATLNIPNSATIKMPAGKKIIVQDGGRLDASSGNAVTFTSQSGNWSGIEFQGTGYGTLTNCTFQNSSTPIVISGAGEVNPPAISVTNCNFYNGPVQITSRPNVTVQNSHWYYNSGNGSEVCGVLSSGSDNVNISNNTIDYDASLMQSTGISIVYGNDVYIQDNYVYDTYVGISISNSSPFVKYNTISGSDPNNALTGISLDNSYSAVLEKNTITGYHTGFYMYNSSPSMLENYAVSNNSTGPPGPSGLHALFYSSPILSPAGGGSQTPLSAGSNNLQNTSGTGVGIKMLDHSVPYTDEGYNTIFGGAYYSDGYIDNGITYYARDNCWVDNPPVSGKFNLNIPVVYEPYTCSPPGRGGESSSKLKDELTAVPFEFLIPNSQFSIPVLPPQPIIVNYGHGVFDTIRVINHVISCTPDRALFWQGLKQELEGSFTAAVNTYQQLIQSYRDSAVAKESMVRILRCRDRVNSDTTVYSQLRNYYLNLAQLNPQDTDFVNIAKELASKCLVRKNNCENAITEYEYVVNNSNDTLQVLCAELNIIETYMIMQSGGGNSPEFTGQLSRLKPVSIKDGIRMLNEKLHRLNGKTMNSILPKEFSLSQNYPNPFNAMTKINYSLPENSKVTLKLYDVLGRFVKTLVDEFKDAGYYTVSFDGSNLASGIYFYRLESGSFADTKKMVLVK